MTATIKMEKTAMGQVVGYIIVEVTGKNAGDKWKQMGVAGAQTYLKSKARLDHKGNYMYREEVQRVGL